MNESSIRKEDETSTDDFMSSMLQIVTLVGASTALRRSKKYDVGRRVVRGLVLLLILLFFLLASLADPHTFQQFLFIALFGGVVTFAIAPYFLSIASKSKLLFPVLAAIAAMAIAVAAYYTHGIWQHALLELSVAIALLVGLDQGDQRLAAISREKETCAVQGRKEMARTGAGGVAQINRTVSAGPEISGILDSCAGATAFARKCVKTP